ncbi:protease complex subunit PrcB family protein [Winogradskyella sp.]|uniref:protease complex subunit PrcB family protein n=1 Tax=Winogradskyella sp. TaxID=1883156 RepID=UPI00261DD9C1|nr:protease complex subunit PrcB family protein [Winogradskyella sp.]
MNKIIVVLILLLPLNCKTKANNSKTSGVENVVLIAKGNLYGSGDEGLEKQSTVISNEKDWDKLLEKINSVNSVSESFLETKIDFSKFRIVAVFDEVKISGGYSIELNIENNTDRILVEVMHKSPEGMATSVMTQPYYIVKIIKNNLQLSLNKKRPTKG